MKLIQEAYLNDSFQKGKLTHQGQAKGVQLFLLTKVVMASRRENRGASVAIEATNLRLFRKVVLMNRTRETQTLFLR